MQVTLKSQSDGPDLRLDKPIVLLGRHDECDVQLNSTKISRRHCVIALVGNKLVIRDLGSTNGVRINGKRFDEGELHDGDDLVIGNFQYCVSMTLNSNNSPPDDANISLDEPVPLPDDQQARAPVAKKAKDIKS